MSSLPNQPRPEDAAKDAEAKKPYEAPVLVRWGTLSELTRAVGNRGASDGGKGKGPRNTGF
jgi:hypothetical protein